MTTWYRPFNALKIVSSKSVIIHLPMHILDVSKMRFQDISYHPPGQTIRLSFQLEEKPVLRDKEDHKPTRVSYHWGDYLE